MYSELVRDHYTNPRNVGHVTEPSAKALMRSPFDSDTVLISLRIEQDVIQEARFKCMGCAVAIACSSMATEMIQGKPVEAAYAVTEQYHKSVSGTKPGYHKTVRGTKKGYHKTAHATTNGVRKVEGKPTTPPQ